MTAVALLKFQQGINIGSDGHAFIASTGTAVTITNSVNTDVASWRIELLYGPPGSSFEQVPGTPTTLAQNAASATPTVNLTPEALYYGCYRIRLTVWEGAGFTGTSSIDIRNIGVPTPNKRLLESPFQKLPDPLPLLGTGASGEKPHELNFEGQYWGWAGGGYDGTTVNFRLLNDALAVLDTMGGQRVQTFTGAGPHVLTGLGVGSKLIALVNAAASVTVQLPATLVDGEIFEIWNTGTNDITVDGNGHGLNGSALIPGGLLANRTFVAHSSFMGGGYFVG